MTTCFAFRGIKKLRGLHHDAPIQLWRGTRNIESADSDEFLLHGGTEQAFMSTTRDLRVAVRYCLSQQSVIFKIVTKGFMEMGADVQWLSAFPGESEILYPPLTYLKPTGSKQVQPAGPN